MSKHITRMSIDEAPHYSPEKRAQMIADWPEHERAARARGVPLLGAGAVFPLSERHLAEVRIQRLERLPHHWYRLGALDFGWEHPTAAVELYHDRDMDIVYVTKQHRLSRATPEEHAIILRPWGKNLRWAWPADGLHETAGGRGIALRDQYAEAGLRMLDEHAHYRVEQDGKEYRDTSVEAGVLDMLDRMRSGRLKVYEDHGPWWEEFFGYHRDEKTGKIVKVMDDLLSATRYGIMMLRFARQPKVKAMVVHLRDRGRNFDS